MVGKGRRNHEGRLVPVLEGGTRREGLYLFCSSLLSGYREQRGLFVAIIAEIGSLGAVKVISIQPYLAKKDMTFTFIWGFLLKFPVLFLA